MFISKRKISKYEKTSHDAHYDLLWTCCACLAQGMPRPTALGCLYEKRRKKDEVTQSKWDRQRSKRF